MTLAGISQVAAVSSNASGSAPQPDAPPKILERPSIAVLPFDNLSRDPAQAYFSDGIVEEITQPFFR